MRTSGTDTSTYHIKKRKAQIEEQCAVMAGRVVPNACVVVVGMSIKDLDEDEDDQYMYYLVIPTALQAKPPSCLKTAHMCSPRCRKIHGWFL